MFETIEAARKTIMRECPASFEVGQRVRIAIVHDQISANSEGTPDRPFGYCPEPAVRMLYPHGTVKQVVTITGK